jgi:hypothetical protein
MGKDFAATSKSVDDGNYHKLLVYNRYQHPKPTRPLRAL